MQLRITTGDGATTRRLDGLQALHSAPGMLIEGSRDIRRIRTSSGAALWLVGTVVGWRGRSGKMEGEEYAIAALGDAAGDLLACARSLEGDFLLVGLGPDGTVDVVPDRFGKRDLYHQRVGNQIFLATDLGLLPISKGAAAYDQIAFAHALLVHARRPAKRQTFYRDVRRLGVGEWVRLQNGGMEIFARTFEPIAATNFGDRELEEYSHLLLDAVRARASHRGNVVYLSSGWDSTAILACLIKLYGPRKVRGVIGRMQYSDRSGVINRFEVERARAIADYYGIDLQIAEFDYRQEGPALLDRVRPLLRANQVASMVALNHWILATSVRESTRGEEAVFAGEISDGAHNLGFSQFVTIFHPVQSFREYSDKMASYLYGPTFVKELSEGRAAQDAVYSLLRSRTSAAFDEPANDPQEQIGQILRSLFLHPNRLPFWSLSNSRLLTDHGREMYVEEMDREYLGEAAARLRPETLYAWYLHLYNSFHWQGSTVLPLRLTAEANQIGMEVPFGDSRLIEFLSAMPEEWGRGLDLNPTKYPLKWALANRIDYPMHLQTGPHSYTYDIDPSFSLAAELLYASSFSDQLREVLRSHPYHDVLSEKVVDIGYLDSLVDAFVKGEEVRGPGMSDLGSLAWLFAIGFYGG